MDEHRVDEIIGAKLRFARKAARKIVAAPPARPFRRKAPAVAEIQADILMVLRMELAFSSTVTTSGRSTSPAFLPERVPAPVSYRRRAF
jgi:hypothetical protein